MKKTLIIIVALTIAALTGCSNRPAKSQALLLQAISYSDGGTTPDLQEKALQIAAKKGILFINKPGGRSREEIVILVANDLCSEILVKYPETPAAIRAAELQRQIEQRLQTMIQLRIQSMYREPYQ